MESGSYSVKQRIDKATLWKNWSALLNTLDIELTERCNNDCIHCYINQPSDDHEIAVKESSTEDIKGILKEAADLGCLSVRFTGGEPLLRADFEELYLFARRLGLKVLLYTNATLITPHLADLFARIPPLEKIDVTVYGMKKSSYEAVTRVPGSFEEFRRGIDLLLERDVPFSIKTVLLPPNRDEIENIASWASDIPWMQDGPPLTLSLDLRCRRDSEDKNRLIKSLRPHPEEAAKNLIIPEGKYVKDTERFAAKFSEPQGDMLFSCGSGVGSGCVDAFGKFQGCMLLRHPDTVYDLKKGSLKDALTNFFPKMREMKAENPDYLARCARCFLKSICGQCPAKSWMEYGTLDTPVEYICEVAHARARNLGLIENGELSWEVENWRERIKSLSERKLVGS